MLLAFFLLPAVIRLHQTRSYIKLRQLARRISRLAEISQVKEPIQVYIYIKGWEISWKKKKVLCDDKTFLELAADR